MTLHDATRQLFSGYLAQVEAMAAAARNRAAEHEQHAAQLTSEARTHEDVLDDLRSLLDMDAPHRPVPSVVALGRVVMSLHTTHPDLPPPVYTLDTELGQVHGRLTGGDAALELEVWAGAVKTEVRHAAIELAWDGVAVRIVAARPEGEH